MKKHTLIMTMHDEERHAYLVTIGTDMGEFTGAAQCREEDYAHESSFFGFELAEIKAEIEYAKAKRNYWKARLKALIAFHKDMAQTRSYTSEAFWVKKLCVERDTALDNVNIWQDRINLLKVLYEQKIKNFDESIKARKAYDKRHGRA